MQQWLVQVQHKLAELVAKNPTLGRLEALIEGELKKLGRPILQHAAQELADRQPLRCPSCGTDLRVQVRQRKRHIESVCGALGLSRDYGLCKQCRKRFYPADHALGLHPRALSSPRVQEICALMVLQSPAAHAQEDARRLTGLHLGQATMHREARRQGMRAIELRRADVALTKTMEGLLKLSSRAHSAHAPFTLVIEIDAWNIRERDDWGKTADLLKRGEKPSRWHWVYTGTIFRLDQRTMSAAGRPVITERGYVATRHGVDAFEEQLYAEAVLRGLLSARDTLVIADGAVWIWNLAQNRFSSATHRLDLWHLKQHLWSVAHDIFGHDSKDADAWIRPLLRCIERRKNGALDVINELQQLRTTLKHLTTDQQKTLQREINYINDNKDRMDYKTAAALGQPLGSGAIESTCGQYQRRFKRTGQFWTLQGDESLLALDTLHRNARWHRLFPHDADRSRL